MTLVRTDVHRPSVIVPTDYSFVAYEHMNVMEAGPEYVMAMRAIIREHMARTGGTYSSHAHGGNCHICGAHCIWTALFYHAPSNTYIRTGLDCMDKLDTSLDGTEFRKRVTHYLERRAGKEKAKGILEAAGAGAAWTIYAEPGSAEHYEENTITDIVGKLVQYGSVSEKQMAFVKALLGRIEKRAVIAAERAAEREAAKPVPVGRMRIVGKVLMTKWVETEFGTTQKMLVAHADGWKVYGTVPSMLRGGTELKGATVEFTATVEASKDDAKFGFFRRPTGGVVMGEAVVADNVIPFPRT